MQVNSLRVLGVFGLLILLAACNKGGGDAGAQSGAGTPGQAGGTAANGEMTVEDAERQTADMVHGVSPGKTGAPVALKFSIAAKPALDAPVDIDVAVIATGASDSMTLSAQGGQGLEVDSETSLASFPKSQTGSLYRHKLKVTPRAEGAFSLSVLVTAVVPGSGPQSRTFSIPMLVGNAAAGDSQAAN